MSQSSITHAQPTLVALQEAEGLRAITLALCKQLLEADGGKIFPVDLLALAAVKRCLSNTAALSMLLTDWNLLATRTVLRSHLDTPLRFSAIWLVKEPHDFAMKVLAGEHVRNLKDRHGRKMTDSYLVERLSAQHPWITVTYERLSGYVHFSADHFAAAVRARDDAERSLSFLLSADDAEVPATSWQEMAECFNECTRILHSYLAGWLVTKANPLLVSRF